MPRFETHLTALEHSTSLYPSRPAFRVPHLHPQTQEILEWQEISYTQFLADVEHFAKYWTQRLTADGVPHRSVVGVW